VGTTLKRNPLLWVALLLLAVAVGTMALLATAQTARADGTGPSVTPKIISGNTTCKTLLGNDAAYELKIDPPKSGTFGPITATISDDGTQVDFTSTVPVLGVFVKGGNIGGNFYDYRPGGTLGDNNLTTPTGPQGQPQQISHVSFCWNSKPEPPKEALTASKTANATYDRTIKWDLTKSVDPDSHNGNAGDSFGSDWTVKATKTATEDNFEVTGKITITNPNATAVGFDVTDKLDDGTMADVDCDPNTAGNQATGTVPANGSATCDYTALPTTKDATSNNVQVSSTTQGVPGATALADVTWKANVIGDEKVTLGDPRFAYSEEISDPATKPFPETFTCPTDPAKYTDGQYSFTETNTATLKGVNTDLSANAAVKVDCSLAALTAKKTANGSFDRKITWDLTKTVTPQSTFSGNAGDSFNYTWNVKATKSVVEDNYKVTGKITVGNPASIAQTFNVADKLDDGTVADVDCDPNTAGNQASATVAAGGSIECSYVASAAKATSNTATVSAPGNKDVEATAPVSYTANVIGDESVTLGDASPKDTPPVSFSQPISDSTTKTFDRTFACPTDPAKYTNFLFSQTNTNTATLKGAKTDLKRDASVTFNCKYPWRAETATGAGTRYPGTSNWFMYTAYQTTKVDLIAGQNYDAGDIYMTRPGDGNTYIKVTLATSPVLFRWANVKENLKIQDFAKAPTSYVEPGSFKYKFTVTPQSTVTYTAKIPGTTAKFYGIHASVERFVN
jgi:hypothetical protein